MKITVLAGGLSPERDVSLTSGSLIANALRRKGNSVALIDVYLGVELDGSPDTLFTETEQPTNTVPEREPDLEALKKSSGNGEALIGKNVIEVCRAADAVFLALHGAMGENGQLQAVLDCFGIKYTGSRYDGSLLAMDKDLTKKMLVQANIPTAESITLVSDGNADLCGFVRKAVNEIGLPCVVKPCSCGSSVGVSIVSDEKELLSALETAFAFEKRVLVEKKISGREMTVGVLGGKALPPVEIIPKTGFYDYKNKYQSGMTDEICPPALTETESKTLSDAALAVAEALRMGYYCRVDFILSPDGTAYCLEANALPGMTPLSLLPREAAASGISYDDLCQYIIQNAH